MKKNIFIVLLLGIMINSCSQKDEVRLITSSRLQLIVDSITSLNKNRNVYEIFVHKIEGYRGFMLLHIGTDPYYDNDMLSLLYFMSNNHKVKIYSGVESYFNMPDQQIIYGRIEGIHENRDHSLWGIYMYKDSIIGVHSVDSANPFLLIPSPPLSEL
jgi:hypothetical protein